MITHEPVYGVQPANRRRSSGMAEGSHSGWLYAPSRLDPGFTVGAADDPAEREADSIAHRVTMTRADGFTETIQHTGCSHGSGLRHLDAGTSSLVGEALARPGCSLDPESTAKFRSHFSHDFSTVRVHSDSAAAASARALNTRAYTVGDAIVFGSGAFDPHSGVGQDLLAH